MYSALVSASPPLSPEIQAFSPSAIRYIKLGQGGAWAAEALANGTIPVGFGEIPHHLAAAGAWDEARNRLLTQQHRPSTVTNWLRELRDFYELDRNCLWCTVADGHLYWTFAHPEVFAEESDDSDLPQRYRTTVDGWHRHDLTGTALTTRSLSSALLRTASYRMTICTVAHQDYLVRRIRGELDPLHVRAKDMRAEQLALTAEIIQQLDWRDFEVLIDLVFARGGWQRRSALGKGEVDVDLLVTSPTTKEVGWVQVKSTATQALLDDYLGRFERDGSCDRFFFACHTPNGSLTLPLRKNLHLWTDTHLAEAVMDAGLFTWLIEQTR
jgi:hypothetical protein